MSASCRIMRMLIVGVPGSGKGTIASRIVQSFGFLHLSSGDLIRAQIAKASEFGRAADSFVQQGHLVPDELVVKLVLSELENNRDKRWLLDGFPRTVQQAKELDKHYDLTSVAHLNVPDEEILRRIAERWIHPGSGRVYNLSYNPPKIQGRDDVTGELLVQREDDKRETVLQRLRGYETVTTPLLNYYSQRKLLVTFTGTESDVLWPEVEKHIRDNLQQESSPCVRL